MSTMIRGPVARVTFGAFLLGVFCGAAVVLKGWLALEAEPEWGRVLMIWGAAVAALCAVPLFLKAETRLNLAMMFAAAGFAAFVFNIYLTYREPVTAKKIREAEAARMEQPNADPRMVFAAAKDFTEAGKPTVPYLTGRVARKIWKDGDILPLAGVSNAVTALCNERGPYLMYQADERGFRNPAGLPEQADVVIIGDSFAHGECVGDGADAAALLRGNGHRAMSLGASGSGPLVELAIQREYALRMKPKVLIWYFFEDNDLEDLLEELENPLLRRYLEDDNFTQNLWDRQGEIDAHWREFLANLQPVAYSGPSTKVHELVTMEPLRTLIGLNRVAHTSWKRDLGRILAKAKERTERENASMYFVYLPGWARYGAKPTLDKEAVLAVVKDAGIPVIDFDQTLSDSGDPLSHFPHRRIGHYAESGQALLAHAIEQQILSGIAKN